MQNTSSVLRQAKVNLVDIEYDEEEYKEKSPNKNIYTSS